MKFSFHPEAEAEFNEAIDYYEDKERGLGYDFAVEVYATIQRIMAFPKAWPVMKNYVSDVGWVRVRNPHFGDHSVVRHWSLGQR
ncbi:MAG: hypothetical protein ACXW04_10040 [Methylobacter sp.]